MNGESHEPHAGTWTPGRQIAQRSQTESRPRKRKARRQTEAQDPDLLPINRSHLGCAGVQRMRERGFSEERIKREVTNWFLKPIPRENRLNGYTKVMKLGTPLREKNRLIHYLTPEQLEKAKSIFRWMCHKHREALSEHPKRLGVYWACAVSRVRARATYANQRISRNRLKGTYNKMLLSEPKVEPPVRRLERQNLEANRGLHRLLDQCEATLG